MRDEPSLCIICAWRENCKKQLLKGKDVSLKCPDFTRDLSIKHLEKDDDEKKDSGDDKGGM